MKDQFVFASSIVDLAEEQDYLTLTNKVCYFDEKNLNDVQLDYDETTSEKCQTLINMPVVAAYKKIDGKDDLGGHEVRIVDGKVKFGTATIGVVTDVEIRQEDVETVVGETRNLPVLYATERIWTRNENTTKAIRRLFSENKLYSSWEVRTSEYSYKDSVRHLVDYNFISNCLLGTRSYPAYGKMGASVTDMAELQDQDVYMVAETILSEALALDIQSASASNINTNQLEDSEKGDTNRKEDLSMENENVVVETSDEKVKEETVEVIEEVAEETAETQTEEVENNEVTEVSEDSPVEESTTEDTESNTETSTEEFAMKTVSDIRKMIRIALNEMDGDDYYDIAFLFPEDKIVLVQSWRMNELEYIQYNYRIDGDKAVLENEQKVELVISPLQINSEIEKKNSALAEANQQITELKKAKEELDKIKAEKAESEHSEAVNKLRNYVVQSGRFTDEEIASERIQKAINDLDESWLKSEIADRLVSSLMAKDNEQTEMEVSETKDTQNTLSIVLSEEKTVSSEDVMRAFFNND